MDDARSAVIELTREAPCPGRREELLRLVAWRNEAPASTATRRHASECPRCRAFVQSVGAEMRLSIDAWSAIEELHGPASAPRVDATQTKAFDRWLDQELRTRSNLDVALAMTRTARWLHRLDPEVAARTVDSEEVESRSGGAGLVASGVVSELRRMIKRRSAVGGDRNRRPTEVRTDTTDREFVDQLARSLSQDVVDRRSRVDTAGALLKRAQQLGKGRLGLTWLVSAQLHWLSGDESLVAEDLDSAGSCINSPSVRACVLINQALLLSESSFGRSNFELLSRALECSPRASVEMAIRTTRLVWTAFAGVHSALDREVAGIERLGLLEAARAQMRPAKMRSQIDYLSERHGVTGSRRQLAARRCIEALHGA